MAHHLDLNVRLETFIEGSIVLSESYFEAYHDRLENHVQKAGKIADLINSILTIGKSSTEMTEGVSKALSIISVDLIKKIVTATGVYHNRQEVLKLTGMLQEFKDDPTKVREVLAKSAAEVFRCFESQLVQVEAADGSLCWQRAMNKVVQDAVNRMINYYKKHPERPFSVTAITSGVILGESKQYSNSTGLFSKGRTVKMGDSKVSTAELFEEVGLKDGDDYHSYAKSTISSLFKKSPELGFRLLYEGEQFNATKYNKLDQTPANPYPYTLTAESLEIEVKKVLEKVELMQKDEYFEKIVNDIQKDAKEDSDILVQSIKNNFSEIKKIIANINAVINDLGETSIETMNAAKEGFEKMTKARDEVKALVKEKSDSLREPIWFDVRNPVALFTGRGDELEELHARLQRSASNVSVISQKLSISGLGGVGKTEFVRAYIDRYSKEYYDIIWINADNEATLNDSFFRLAENRLRLSTINDSGNAKPIKCIVQEVYLFFAQRKCLFVFDNAEKGYYMDQYLPDYSLPGDAQTPYVLLTSRNREWGLGVDVEVLDLSELTPDEAVEFVKKGLDIEIKDDAFDLEITELVTKLQYFPLAIQQAISYIDNLRNEGFWVREYVKKYREQTEELLGCDVFRGIDNDYARTTYTTWKMSIDKITYHEHGSLALEVLNIAAYIAPDNIKREAFFCLNKGTEEQYKSAVRLLVKYSMMNAVDKQSLLNVHRLVQQVTRLNLETGDNYKHIVRLTYELIGLNFPYTGDTLKQISKKKDILPHAEAFSNNMEYLIEKNPEVRQLIEEEYLEKVWVWMSEGYSNLGNPQRQKDLQKRLLEIQTNHYGSDHYYVGAALNNLGLTFGRLGDIVQEKECLEKALAINIKHYGPNHFEVGQILVNLGGCYDTLGDYLNGVETQEKALVILEEHYGKDHVKVAKVMRGLGEAYIGVGNKSKAKDLIEKAVPILQEHFGSDHYEVAKALHTLGNLYGALGNYRKEKEALEQALAIKETYYGSTEHFELASTIQNLGASYEALGDLERAKQILERALNIKENHYGRDHFQTAHGLNNLGRLCGLLGDHGKEKEFLERSLPIIEKHYGHDHTAVATVLINLGICYRELGDMKKQLETQERLLSILEDRYENDDYAIVIINTLVDVSNIYSLMMNQFKQIDLLERAVGVLQRRGGMESFIVSKLETLGCLYQRTGQLQKERESLERLWAITEKLQGIDSIDVAQTLFKLGQANVRSGDYRTAQSLLEQALPIYKKHFGPDHKEVGTLLLILSQVYFKLKDYEKQKEVLQITLSVFRKHFGEEDLIVARTLEAMSLAHSSSGDHQKARDFLEQAVPMLEKHYGKEHINISKSIIDLGITYGDLGNHQKEIELVERGLAIKEKCHGTDHFEVGKTLRILSRSYRRLGSIQQEKRCLEKAVAILGKHLGPNHPEMARPLLRLGKIYEIIEVSDRCIDVLQRALNILQNQGLENVELAAVLVNLSNAYAHLKNHNKQKELLERALHILENIFSCNHVLVAYVHTNLSYSYSALGDYEKQVASLEKALTVFQTQQNPNEEAKVQGALGAAYIALGETQKAKACVEKKLAIEEKHFGERFPLLRTLHDLEEIYRELGEVEKEQSILERMLAILETDHQESDTCKSSMEVLVSREALFSFQVSSDSWLDESLFRGRPVIANN